MDLFDFVRDLQATFDRMGRRAYIMYHGTTLRCALLIWQNGFIPSSEGMLGPGVYVTRSFQKARAYPKRLLPGDEKVVLKLRVRVGRVKRISYQDHPLQYTWHQAGYDTAWVPPNCGMVPSGLEEDCVWDPERIKVLEVLDKNGNPRDVSRFGCPFLPPGPPIPFPAPMRLSFGIPCPAPIASVPDGEPIPSSSRFQGPLVVPRRIQFL